MDSSLHGITPLRQRMIDDMRMRKLAEKTQSHYFAPCDSWPRSLGARLTRPLSRICGATNCTWSISALRRCRSMLRSPG